MPLCCLCVKIFVVIRGKMVDMSFRKHSNMSIRANNILALFKMWVLIISNSLFNNERSFWFVQEEFCSRDFFILPTSISFKNMWCLWDVIGVFVVFVSTLINIGAFTIIVFDLPLLNYYTKELAQINSLSCFCLANSVLVKLNLYASLYFLLPDGLVFLW